MAVIDDDFLMAAMRGAAESFVPPQDGTEEILRRARGSNDEQHNPTEPRTPESDGIATTSLRSLRTTINAHRLLSSAAAVIVVAAVGGGALLFGSGPATRQLTAAPLARSTTSSKSVNPTAGGAAAPGALSVPSTTEPPLSQSAGGVRSGAGATATNGAVATPTPATPATPATPSLPAGVTDQSARIEQTGALDLTVSRGALATTITKLTFLAEAYSGFVANSQTQSGGGSGPQTGSVTLQVPVASFSAVLKSAQALGKTTQLSTKATDVTGQYVDLQARITALQASRQQYLTIMARASSIGDVLAVQSQLDNLQSQIEQLQGQLQLLTSQTSYSTLTVLVSESTTGHHHVTKHPENGLAKAWHKSVHGFVDGFEWLVRIAGPVLFILLFAGVLLVAGRLGWRRYQRHSL
jgi:uncharacterized protein DUF4349